MFVKNQRRYVFRAFNLYFMRHTYYTPKFTKFQVFLAKTDNFVDYDG